jgi:spore germination cell wall hydrolase CwlJ-like protein
VDYVLGEPMLKLIFTTVITLIPAICFAQTEKQCMANVVYHEANSESVVGKRAVLDVVMNRARKYKKSVCDIIKQPSQFSWYGKKSMLPFDKKLKKMLAEVEAVGRVLISEKYLFFYHRSIKPKWAKKMDCFRMESHMFCQMKGEEYGKV